MADTAACTMYVSLESGIPIGITYVQMREMANIYLNIPISNVHFFFFYSNAYHL